MIPRDRAVPCVSANDIAVDLHSDAFFVVVGIFTGTVGQYANTTCGISKNRRITLDCNVNGTAITVTDGTVFTVEHQFIAVAAQPAR